MLFLVRMVYWVFAGAIAAKLISFLFNPRSTSLEGLISSLWSQFNTGTLYYVCVCTAAGYSRMYVAGLLLLLLPPVGGSFIDFSRSVAHTEESSVPLMSLVVIFAPLAPFLCLSHHCCCWCCHFMFINALGLDKLAPKKQFSENCLQQKVVAALSDPPSPSAPIHTPLGAETAQTALRLKQNLSFTHICTQNPPPTTAPPLRCSCFVTPIVDVLTSSSSSWLKSTSSAHLAIFGNASSATAAKMKQIGEQTVQCQPLAAPLHD